MSATAVTYVNGVAHFYKGVRVRLSEAGRRQMTSSPYRGGRRGRTTDWATRQGIVAAPNRQQYVSVLWDGNKHPSIWHHSLLEWVPLS